jgi:hypothetical protein
MKSAKPMKETMKLKKQEREDEYSQKDTKPKKKLKAKK